MTSSQHAAGSYDAYYFQHGCGDLPYERTPGWLQFFAGIAERIVQRLAPRTVLDAGCAMGFLVEGLRERGVEAFGVDISEYALQQVRDDLKPYCWRGSVAEPFPRRYDLIVCIEVLEHLSPAACEQAVANFCQHSDDILFSSTPTDYRETTHLNVQPPEYWAELFARQGFVRDVDFDASFITPWAARFRRTHEPLPRTIRDYERRFWLLWKENHDLRGLTVEMRDQLAANDQALKDLNVRLTEEATLNAQQVEALRAQVARQTEVTQALSAQVTALTQTGAWRVAQFLRRLRLTLAPDGSLRVRALDRLLQLFVGRKG